jgi:hypothetical protein
MSEFSSGSTYKDDSVGHSSVWGVDALGEVFMTKLLIPVIMVAFIVVHILLCQNSTFGSTGMLSSLQIRSKYLIEVACL